MIVTHSAAPGHGRPDVNERMVKPCPNMHLWSYVSTHQRRSTVLAPHAVNARHNTRPWRSSSLTIVSPNSIASNGTSSVGNMVWFPFTASVETMTINLTSDKKFVGARETMQVFPADRQGDGGFKELCSVQYVWQEPIFVKLAHLDHTSNARHGQEGRMARDAIDSFPHFGFTSCLSRVPDILPGHYSSSRVAHVTQWRGASRPDQSHWVALLRFRAMHAA